MLSMCALSESPHLSIVDSSLVERHSRLYTRQSIQTVSIQWGNDYHDNDADDEDISNDDF